MGLRLCLAFYQPPTAWHQRISRTKLGDPWNSVELFQDRGAILQRFFILIVQICVCSGLSVRLCFSSFFLARIPPHRAWTGRVVQRPRAPTDVLSFAAHSQSLVTLFHSAEKLESVELSHCALSVIPSLTSKAGTWLHL